jgi:hypothetical protein
MLNDIIVAEQRSKLRAVAIDVSVPDGQRVGAAKRRRKKAKSSRPKGKFKFRPLKGSSKKTLRAQRKVKPRAGKT